VGPEAVGRHAVHEGHGRAALSAEHVHEHDGRDGRRRHEEERPEGRARWQQARARVGLGFAGLHCKFDSAQQWVALGLDAPLNFSESKTVVPAK